jgi:hypothetical protein
LRGFPFSPRERGEGGRRPDEGTCDWRASQSQLPSPCPLPARAGRGLAPAQPFCPRKKLTMPEKSSPAWPAALNSA